MNKEDRLYKLSQGSDTAVWAHDEIIKQDKRIAELEEIIRGRDEFKRLARNKKARAVRAKKEV